MIFRKNSVLRSASLLGLLALSILNETIAAPILLTNANGYLTGALKVGVLGEYYDVSFKEGSCNSLFPIGCNIPVTQTKSFSIAASQALLDTVFIDSPLGLFDSKPELTFGCQTGLCDFITPYLYPSSPGIVESEMVLNSDEENLDSHRLHLKRASEDTTWQPILQYAVWTTSPIDEPDHYALICAGLTGLVVSLRYKRSLEKISLRTTSFPT